MRPKSAPNGYMYKQTVPPSTEKIVSKVLVFYDKNGHKVVKKTEDVTISTILSSMIEFDKMVIRNNTDDLGSPWQIHYPCSELKVPKAYAFEPQYHHNFLSSTAISLNQMIQSRNRTSAWRESEFPDWICLRERYLSLLENLSQKILQFSDDQECIPDFMKKETTTLLRAIRLVTVKILTCYERELPLYGYRNDPSNEECDSWRVFLSYLAKIPTSLDWLDIEPFRSICGLHMQLNPFCCGHNLSMELAVVIKGNFQEVMWALEKQPSHKMLSDKEEVDGEDFEPYNSHLVTLLPKDLYYSEEEDMQYKKFYSSLVHFSRFHDSSLVNIISGKDMQRKYLEQVMVKRCELVVSIQELYLQRSTFRRWIGRFVVVSNVKNFVRKRRKKLKKIIFEGFKLNIMKERRLSALNSRYKVHLVTTALDSWKAVVVWCKRYRVLQKRCVDNWKRSCIDKWRRFIEYYTFVPINDTNFIEHHGMMLSNRSSLLDVYRRSNVHSNYELKYTFRGITMANKGSAVSDAANNLTEWNINSVPATSKEQLVEDFILKSSCPRAWVEERNWKSRSYMNQFKIFLDNAHLSITNVLSRHTRLHPSLDD